jgi:hypothetical protein
MRRRLTCLFRRHDWHSEYDHEHRRTTWTCQRCGLHKVTTDDFVDRGRVVPATSISTAAVVDRQKAWHPSGLSRPLSCLGLLRCFAPAAAI